METNEELYYKFRSRYYDSCNQVNACEREITYLNNLRRDLVNRINSLDAQLRKLRDTIEDIKGVLGREGAVETKFTNVSSKVDAAAVNYTAMVSSGEVSAKDLNSVFNGENRQTKSTISGIFEIVKNRKAALENELSSKQTELNNAQNELSETDAKIRSEQNELTERKREKKNNLYNMEYYKRKMDEEAW